MITTLLEDQWNYNTMLDFMVLMELELTDHFFDSKIHYDYELDIINDFIFLS